VRLVQRHGQEIPVRLNGCFKCLAPKEHFLRGCFLFFYSLSRASEAS
jgi:hypothetical protein